MKPKLVIFDFDGVLVDSKQQWIYSFKTALERHNIKMSDDFIEHEIGPTIPEVLRVLLLTQQIKVTDELVEDVKSISESPEGLSRVNPFPDAKKTLLLLREHGIKTALVTNTHRSLIELLFKKYGWEGLFDSVVTYEDCTKHKPDPQPVTITIERLDVKPRETIVVGDTTLDMRMAKTAETEAIGILSGWHSQKKLEKYTDKTVKDLPELQKFLSLTTEIYPQGSTAIMKEALENAPVLTWYTLIIVMLALNVLITYASNCSKFCDDGNMCTQEICSMKTNFLCSQIPLEGPVTGCAGDVDELTVRLCSSGECIITNRTDGVDLGTLMKIVNQTNSQSNSCGNNVCDLRETRASCPGDCPDCNDGNSCTNDTFDYVNQTCRNMPISCDPGYMCKSGLCEKITSKIRLCEIERQKIGSLLTIKLMAINTGLVDQVQETIQLSLASSKVRLVSIDLQPAKTGEYSAAFTVGMFDSEDVSITKCNTCISIGPLEKC